MIKTLFSVITVGKKRLGWLLILSARYIILFIVVFRVRYYIIFRTLKLLYGFHTDFTQSIYSVNAGY